MAQIATTLAGTSTAALASRIAGEVAVLPATGWRGNLTPLILLGVTMTVLVIIALVVRQRQERRDKAARQASQHAVTVPSGYGVPAVPLTAFLVGETALIPSSNGAAAASAPAPALTVRDLEDIDVDFDRAHLAFGGSEELVERVQVKNVGGFPITVRLGLDVTSDRADFGYDLRVSTLSQPAGMVLRNAALRSAAVSADAVHVAPGATVVVYTGRAVA